MRPFDLLEGSASSLEEMKVALLAVFASAIFFCSFPLSAQASREAPRRVRSGTEHREEKPLIAGWRSASAPPEAPLPIALYGSIRTFGATGSQQIFVQRGDVFFGTGSAAAPCQTFELIPDGAYVFQVTDPSGKTLLSSDPASERTIVVRNGVIASYAGATHAVGVTTDCGSLTVGLAPFRHAGSRRAAYVGWLTPIASFEGDPASVDVICGDGCFHGFRAENSRTVFFRVEDQAFCDPTFCASGVKFTDSNGNGIRDVGELPFAGVEIRAANDFGVVLSGVAGPDGVFKICGLTNNDAFRIYESVPFGYAQTAPLDQTLAQRVFARGHSYVLQVCDSDVARLDFGNRLTPNAIGGIKYEDQNANGRRDPGEPGMPGVDISLSPLFAGPGESTLTDRNGNFLFTDLSPGSYLLTEKVPTGFTQTEPASASGTVEVTLALGGSSIANHFGNFRGLLTGEISGVKFQDVNGNGVRESGEPPQEGVSITLTGPSSFVPRTDTTTPDGVFAFTDVPFGSYTLSESVPSGFQQTAPAAPGTIPVSLFLGQSTSSGNLFGNQAVSGSISGTKYNDLNANGVRDPAESGIPGVEIRLEDRAHFVTTTRTDDLGSFAFAGLSAGEYILAEVVPPGFVQTEPPVPGTISISLQAGRPVTGLLFGNHLGGPLLGSISGSKYLDLNANGIVDGNDRPLEGIEIILTDASGLTRRVTSGVDGAFLFSDLPPGTYTLIETLPPNFFQTFPGTPAAPAGYTITLEPAQNAGGFRFLNKC